MHLNGKVKENVNISRYHGVQNKLTFNYDLSYNIAVMEFLTM